MPVVEQEGDEENKEQSSDLLKQIYKFENAPNVSQTKPPQGNSSSLIDIKDLKGTVQSQHSNTKLFSEQDDYLTSNSQISLLDPSLRLNESAIMAQ